VFAKLWGLNQLTESAINEKIMQHLIVNEMYQFTTEGQNNYEIEPENLIRPNS